MKTTLHPTRALIAALLLVAAVGAQAAGLRAYFDRNPVYAGETVTLTIEASGSASGGPPELAPLTRDFTVLGTSQGSEVRIINGHRSDTTRWQISLQPNGQGNLTVPALSLGGMQTEPLTLEVRELPPDVAKRQAESLFIETELGAEAQGVHVQQQIPLTVRLYASVPISEGSLSDPAPADTVVERLGEDRSYSTERNGRRYQVIERHYALFPERSGELTIPPVTFRGSVVAQRGQRGRGYGGTAADRMFNDPLFDRVFRDSGFGRAFSSSMFGADPTGMFSPRRPITAQGQQLSLEVLPRPDGAAANNWLPAQNVELIDSWQQQVPEWQVGKPVERTITVRATGLAGSQIPALTLAVPDGLRSYPSQPQRQSRTDGDRVYGISTQTFTYIPTRAGSLEMPEVKVDWWDTVSQQPQVATLPRWQLQVAPGVMPADAPPQPQPLAGAASAPTSVGNSAAEAGMEDFSETVMDKLKGFDWYAAAPWAGVALLVLLMMAMGARFRRRNASSAAAQAAATGLAGSPPPTKPAVAQLREAFNKACGSGDAAAIARALMAWARAEWSQRPPTGLVALAGRLQQGADEVRALERALYAPDAGNWDASGLQHALSRGLIERPTEHSAAAPDLAPLYPQR